MALYRVPVTIVSPNSDGNSLNVLHVRTLADPGDPLPDANLEEAVDALRACYTAHRDAYPTPASITIGTGIIRDPYGSPTYVPDIAGDAITGQGGPDYAPPHLALCVALRTTAATRRGRGRVFLGPLTLSMCQGADGTVDTTRLGTVRTAWAALIADSVTANGWGLSVWSNLDSVARDVVGATVKDRFAVMRSRRP